MTRAMAGLLAAAFLAVAPLPAAAQTNRHALLVEGASGTDEYATLHRGWLDQLLAVLRDDFDFDASRIHVLADTPGPDEARATADNLRATLTQLASEVGEDDLLFVMLIGHGGGQGADAKFNLVGRDLTVAEWTSLVSAVPGRLVFVNGTSASFPYLEGIAGQDRVVITATNSYAQQYHAQFAGKFIQALSDEEADADKNNRISMLEAFNHASFLVGEHYAQAGNMATENAVLDDTGDGAGRVADAEGEDGDLAALTYLEPMPLPTSADPEVQQLIAQQAELTARIDELRRNRRAMGDDVFLVEFERLIVELSLVSRDVRRRTGG